MKPHYQQTPEELFFAYDSGKDGLTTQQVAEHQEKYGTNKMEQGKKKPVWVLFLEQFKDFLVIILIIAAVASGFMGDVESAAVILIVITMNAILGTVQTIKAEQSLASLKKLSGPEAKRRGSCADPFRRSDSRRYCDAGSRRLYSGRRKALRVCQHESG